MHMSAELSESLAVLLAVIIGLMIILRVLRLGTALILLMGAGFLPSVLPGAVHWFSGIPPIVALFIAAWLGIAALRLIVRPLLGDRAASSMAGNLAANLVTFMLQIFLLPFRFLRRLLTLGRGQI